MLALSGASAAMAEEPPSVWPRDIYSADPNSTAGENPGDEAEGAPAQTVDLSTSDIDWSQLDPAPFRAGLVKSGFYAQWQKTYGVEAWGRLEQYTGPLM